MDSWVGDIEQETLGNDTFRTVLFTGEHTQLTVMQHRAGRGHRRGRSTMDTTSSSASSQEARGVELGRQRGRAGEGARGRRRLGRDHPRRRRGTTSSTPGTSPSSSTRSTRRPSIRTEPSTARRRMPKRQNELPFVRELTKKQAPRVAVGDQGRAGRARGSRLVARAGCDRVGVGGGNERSTRGRLRVRSSSLSADVRSALRSLLPLPQLPAADRNRALVINLLIETDRVELLAGEPQPVAVPRGDGKKQKIWRCPTCQIAVFSQYTTPKIRFVRGGTLDDPASVVPNVCASTRGRSCPGRFPRRCRRSPTYYNTQKLWPAASLERLEALKR